VSGLFILWNMIAKLKMTKTMDKLNDKKKKARAVMTTHSGGVMKRQYTVHTFSLERSYLSERERMHTDHLVS